MELSSPQDIHEVEADGTLRIPSVGGVGFALTAVEGNAGGYPLHAMVNGEGTPSLIIEGGHVYGQGMAVEALKVDVKPGGGRVGDKWRLVVRQAATDERATRYPTDGLGLLRVAPPGARRLFMIDHNEWGAFSQLSSAAPWVGNPASVDFAVCRAPTGSNTARISAPQQGARFMGPAWDVSGFSQVIFVVEQFSNTAGAHPGRGIQAFIGLVGWDSDYGPPLVEVPCGSVNEFGTPNSGPTWTRNAFGCVYLGLQGPPISTEYFTATPLRAPLARFFLRVSGGPLNAERLMLPGYGLRLYAVGW